MPGGHSGEVIPVPIPNTEVKLSSADDTAEKWESRKLPGFFLFKKKPAQDICWAACAENWVFATSAKHEVSSLSNERTGRSFRESR